MHFTRESCDLPVPKLEQVYCHLSVRWKQTHASFSRTAIKVNDQDND